MKEKLQMSSHSLLDDPCTSWSQQKPHLTELTLPRKANEIAYLREHPTSGSQWMRLPRQAYPPREANEMA